jgi:hypothetical protein
MLVYLIHEPPDYKKLLTAEPPVKFTSSADQAALIQLFASSASVFYEAMEQLKPIIDKNPEVVIWVSWCKKSSGIATDLTEALIRSYALSTTLVDIKVCAVTEQWSGLKLVVRRKNRKRIDP